MPSPSPACSAQGREVRGLLLPVQKQSRLHVKGSLTASCDDLGSQLCYLEIDVIQTQILGSSTQGERFSESEGPSNLARGDFEAVKLLLDYRVSANYGLSTIPFLYIRFCWILTENHHPDVKQSLVHFTDKKKKKWKSTT